MGTKLNPDSAKIKALRLQRGWTQEQLAEIAGVSPRTIQRAETANCAAFETVRAIAGAFETDFDQLIKTDAPDSPGPDLESVHLEPGVSSAVGMAGPAALAQPAPAYGRAWITFGIAAFALTAGLVAGIGFTSRLNRTSESYSPPPALLAMPAQHAQASQTSPQPAAVPMETAVAPETAEAPGSAEARKTVRNHSTAGAVRDRNHRAVERHPETSIPVAQVATLSVAAEAPPHEPILLSRHAPPPDLPLQSPERLSALAILELPVVSNSDSGSSTNFVEGGQGPGAVRQAMDAAARKTGSFVSKVGTSLKRAF